MCHNDKTYKHMRIAYFLLFTKPSLKNYDFIFIVLYVIRGASFNFFKGTIMNKLITMLTPFFIFSMSAFGHPPADMNAYFDANEHSMIVTLRHRTLNGKSHHIKNYRIMVNDQTFDFEKNDQDGSEPRVVLDLGHLQIKDYTKVTIIATCSLFGSLTRDFQFLDGNLTRINFETD